MRYALSTVIAALTVAIGGLLPPVMTGRFPSESRAKAGVGALRPKPESLGLVGVWRVVRFCEVDSSGRETQPLGPRPTGYFIYAPSGQLSIQAMRTPPIPHFVTDTAPTNSELQTLFHGYFGYFGTYTVTSDTTVVHHVLGGDIPKYIGTDQPRPYWIWGAHRDSLSIGSRRGRACRLLVRIA